MPGETISLDKMVELLFQFGETQGMETTYQGIARATGIAWNNIRKLRTGENTNPTLATIQALADYFGVKLDYFNCRTEGECWEYLAQIAEKKLAGQLVEAEVRMRSNGISLEGIQTLQAMINYIKQVEGISSSHAQDSEQDKDV